MPHKHKRKRDADSDFDLPPSQRAKSLPVQKSRAGEPSKTARPTRKRERNKSKDNDAPRAFRRLMAFTNGKKRRSGLDNGGEAPATSIDTPRIRSGEDMRSFSARVDAALPVSGLTQKSKIKDGKDEFGFKVFRTRKERKMHKLYDQWRAEERKIQERKEDALEEAAERELDNDAAGITTFTSLDSGTAANGGKKSRRRRGSDEDPWLALKRKRAESKPRLNDVVQAPPELSKGTSRQLKTGDGVEAGSDDRSTSGAVSTKKEELQAAREEAIDAYRKMRDRKQARHAAFHAREKDAEE